MKYTLKARSRTTDLTVTIEDATDLVHADWLAQNIIRKTYQVAATRTQETQVVTFTVTPDNTSNTKPQVREMIIQPTEVLCPVTDVAHKWQMRDTTFDDKTEQGNDHKLPSIRNYPKWGLVDYTDDIKNITTLHCADCTATRRVNPTFVSPSTKNRINEFYFDNYQDNSSSHYRTS